MSSRFDVPIDRGHIMQFARAIGDEDILARIADRSACGSKSLVPPTFLEVASHFDPAFARRPRAGVPWPNEVQIPMAEPGSASPGPPLHVGQRFDYTRPPRPGETLLATREPAREWIKQGRRGGNLRFVELVTSFVDAGGSPVARSAWLDVYTEQGHQAMSTAEDDRAATDKVTRDRAAEPDDTIEIVANLSRTQIAMYIGAVGDFHPLHHDERFALDHGYPSIFVPGMLTMALAGRAISTHLDPSSLSSFEGRFHRQVWPGDSITAWLTNKTAATVDVQLVNQHQQTLFTGSATGSTGRPAA